MTVSIWSRSATPRRVACDVAVLGAGVSGLSAMTELRRRGVDAVVVERGRPGAGASSRNAGFLMRGAARNYAASCAAYGRERARELWAFTEANQAELRAIGVADLPGYAARPSCLVAFAADEERDLRASVRLLEEDGFACRGIEPGAGPDDALWARGRVRYGLANPEDASCSPAELIGLAASRIEPERMLTGQEVTGIEPSADGGVLVRTPDADVACTRVLACLNAYVGSVLPALDGVVVPNRGQMLAAVPEADPRLACCYYANGGSEYLRPGPDGTVLIGGARAAFREAEQTPVDATSEPVQSRLEAYLGDWLGTRFRVTARWSGIMGFSPDHLPMVGPVPHPGIQDGALWFCGGFSGQGMSMGWRAARLAVASMLDGADHPFMCPSLPSPAR